MKFGPFNLTNDLSIGNIVEIVLLMVGLIKFLVHLNNESIKLHQLYTALFGKGPQDNEAWFNRFTVIETRVNEMWSRLKFSNIR